MLIPLLLLSVARLVSNSDQEPTKAEGNGSSTELPIKSDSMKDVGEYFERFRNKVSNLSNVLEIRTLWIYNEGSDSSNKTEFFPPRMEVDVCLRNKNFTLNLTEKTLSAQGLASTSSTDIELRGYYEYKHLEATATVIVKNVSEDIQEIHYEIEFNDGVRQYRLKPADLMRDYDLDAEYTLLDLNGIPHVLETSSLYVECFIDEVTALMKTFLIADQSVFKKFLSMERQELSDTEKAENAKMKILSCFDKIVEGARGMVKDFEEEYFKFIISQVNDLIVPDEESQFIEQAKIDNESIDGELALKGLLHQFAGKVSDNIDEWSPNIAVVFTSYNILINGEKQPGIGVFNSICTHRNFAIVQLKSIVKSSKTLVRQIAHSLGIPNDGKENECLPEENFVMGFEETSEETFGYNLHLSKCSIDKFVEIRRGINIVKGNCFLHLDWKQSPEQEFVELFQFNLNSQCKLLVGSTSQYCGDNHGEDMCSNITCNHGGNTQCFKFPFRVYNGTPCYNGTCINGVCKFEELSP